MQFNAIRYEILICIAILIAVSSLSKNDVWRVMSIYITRCAVLWYGMVQCSAVWCGVVCVVLSKTEGSSTQDESVSESVGWSACLSCVTNSTI
jgi:prolipoprotein diacylglyceryltransferase